MLRRGLGAGSVVPRLLPQTVPLGLLVYCLGLDPETRLVPVVLYRSQGNWRWRVPGLLGLPSTNVLNWKEEMVKWWSLDDLPLCSGVVPLFPTE